MYFEDEHILSFLFRTQVIYGYFDFSNLFKKNGKTKGKFYIQKELLHTYHLYNERKIYELLNKMTQEKIQICTPYNKLFYLREFLNNGIAYSDILDNDTFNFCIECIEESYKENGVGYLKREWLNSKCCNKHKTPLFTVLNHSLRDSVEIMMDLMSGKKPHSHNYRLNTRRETKYSKNIETDFDPASTLYIKPCAKEVFNKWIRDHKHSLLKIIPPRYHSQDNLHRVHLFQQNPSIYIADLYLNRHNNNLLEFKNFIFKNTRIVIEKHGVNREDSFSDRIMKDRNMKCENCNINSPSTPCKMQHKTNGRNI